VGDKNTASGVIGRAATHPGGSHGSCTPPTQRVTATMSWQLHQRLQKRADEEGRSFSNLISFLLEAATA